MTDSSKKIQLKRLYAWYARNKRDLPFRHTRDAYRIWISEVMLQQTRVAAMLPRYTEFLRRFPDIESLAAAGEETVLRAWQGLGYYSRARNLHRAARIMVAQHQARFPEEYAAVRAIHGIGPYTAAAVLSMAYGAPYAALDGNVRRVTARLFASRTTAEREFQSLADQLMDMRGRADPGVHNQALMELGSTLCLPTNPRCVQCPLRLDCNAYQQGGVTGAVTYPVRKPKKETIEVEMYIYLIKPENDQRILLVRESNSRFLQNLWFYPHRLEFANGTTDRTQETRSLTALEANWRSMPRKLAHTFKHSITHHRITGSIHLVQSQQKAEQLLRTCSKLSGELQDWQLVALEDVSEYVISSIGSKVRRTLARSGAI